ncbi:uncharacterized protein BT62DRAFT_97384 [Guyanagaster necrorhizus]|uniref:WW domain-containing protein n=1 Tax=Guyanagaster necrorhizus TaxID=856835 RepID=A0A9P7VV42_9AGAR|nr:uncharacterized protein BT62DRAFT_97384 [Guyanagaster necrorhizus MCA 3950]KAG7447015.1 hypothetical protein BT62DRAFT_97384 [Guyanagaster necrorhizus MCA 3950]
MMEHDIEVDYDYADDDETGLADHSRKLSRPGDVDDDEDAVSLGPDEDEPGYYHKDSYQNDTFPSEDGDAADANDDGTPSSSTPHSTNLPQHKPQPSTRENSVNSPRNTTSPQRSHSHINIIHGLPPKPVVANVPFLHPSHPSLIEATAMSRTTAKTKTSSGNNGFAAKPPSSVDAKELPLDWQIRKSHNGDMYYYNTKTHVSTWERPVRNGLQDDKTSQPMHFPTSGSSGPKDLSYEDRHYRPGENGAPPGDSRPPVLPPSNRGGTTDTWFGSAVAPSYDSRTPPDSPQHGDQLRSPLPMPQRGRRRRHANYDGEAINSHGDSRRPMTPPRRTETDTLQESRRQPRVHDYEPPQAQSKFPIEREKLPVRQEPSSRNNRGNPPEREPRDSQPQNTTSSTLIRLIMHSSPFSIRASVCARAVTRMYAVFMGALSCYASFPIPSPHSAVADIRTLIMDSLCFFPFIPSFLLMYPFLMYICSPISSFLLNRT